MEALVVVYEETDFATRRLADGSIKLDAASPRPIDGDPPAGLSAIASSSLSHQPYSYEEDN
jgi:hypothetical protein